MKEITLTETQYHTLLQALNELYDMEIEASCNDCFKGDKFYTLSKKEQREAKKSAGALFNCTATGYLLDILQTQNP
jgi:hypothetical protein